MSQSIAVGSSNTSSARGFVSTAVAAYALLAIAALSVSPTLRSLELYWRGVHDYQHGYLIAGATVVWLYTCRKALAACALRPSWPGALLLAAAILLWLIANVAASQIGQQVLVPLILFLAVWAGAGSSAAHAILRPLLFVYFAIPIWDFLIPPLQHMTVVAAQTAMALGGVPAVVSDFTVSIPEGTFAIIEGCSGKKYLIAALATAAAAAALGGFERRRFVLLLGVSTLLALLTNWIRVITVIAVGHLSHMQNYLVRVEHRSFGNVLWLMLLVVILWVAARLKPADPGKLPDVRAAAPALTQAIPLARVILPCGLLIAGGALALLDPSRRAPPAVLPPLPLAVSTWQGPFPGSTQWSPKYVGAGAERRGAYAAAAGTVEVYANVYARQSAGRKLVSYQNELLGPGVWQLTASSGSTSDSGALLGERPRLISAFDPDGRRWVISYSYYVGTARTASDAVAQLLYGATAMEHVPLSGMIALASPCSERDCAAAATLVQSFWRDMREPIEGFLSIAGGRSRPGTVR